MKIRVRPMLKYRFRVRFWLMLMMIFSLRHMFKIMLFVKVNGKANGYARCNRQVKECRSQLKVHGQQGCKWYIIKEINS